MDKVKLSRFVLKVVLNLLEELLSAVNLYNLSSENQVSLRCRGMEAMNSKYLRLSQESLDLLYAGDEKQRDGIPRQWLSWRSLILSVSVFVNIFLSTSALWTLRDKPTPTGYGENREALRVILAADRSQPRSILLRPHGPNDGGTRLIAPKITLTATSCGKLSYHLMVS